MKKSALLVIAAMVVVSVSLFSFTNENKAETKFLQVTSIESVVPMGLGRSRMITAGADGVLEEVKMENFFSAVGINFANIRFNDRTITDKIEDLYRQGWELQAITPGVYAADKSTGIFITRYLFKKAQ